LDGSALTTLNAGNLASGTVPSDRLSGTYGISISGSAGSAPASDVYAWAKASTKPSYGFTEISGTATDAQVPNTITIDYATSAGSATSASSAGYANTAGSANNDADISATNEIQTLGTSGNTITLTSGGSVTAPYATSAGSAPASDVYSWAKASTKPSYGLSCTTVSSGYTQSAGPFTLTCSSGYTATGSGGYMNEGIDYIGTYVSSSNTCSCQNPIASGSNGWTCYCTCCRVE
jgi:hypothetical protein